MSKTFCAPGAQVNRLSECMSRQISTPLVRERSCVQSTPAAPVFSANKITSHVQNEKRTTAGCTVNAKFCALQAPELEIWVKVLKFSRDATKDLLKISVR
jgi:hypothetical protein